MPSLADLINAKIAADGISFAKLVESTGLAEPSLRNVVKGRSLPNRRSFDKYSKFLGVPIEEIATTVAADKKAAGPSTKEPKAAKEPKAPKPAKVKAARSAKVGDVGVHLDAIKAALASADALAGDALAVKVHALGKSQRATISAIVDAIS